MNAPTCCAHSSGAPWSDGQTKSRSPAAMLETRLRLFHNGRESASALLLNDECGTMPRASGQPLSGVSFSWENQDRLCAVRSEALVDRAAEALCERFYDLESVPGIGICFARTVVRDSTFDERQRRQQFDANQASAVTERVTFCIRDEFRHDQTESPAALGIHPKCALHQPELYALAFKF